MSDIKRLDRLNKKHTVRACKQCRDDMHELNEAMEGMNFTAQERFEIVVMSAANVRMGCMRLILGIGDVGGINNGKNDAAIAKAIRDMAEELASSLEKERGQ